MFPRFLILPALVCAGFLLFYEGFPFLYEGRVDRVYARGQMEERQIWEDLQRKLNAQLAALKAKAQAQIDALESDYWVKQTDQAIAMSDLQKQLETEKADAQNSNGACAPVISRGVRDRLQAIGR